MGRGAQGGKRHAVREEAREERSEGKWGSEVARVAVVHVCVERVRGAPERAGRRLPEPSHTGTCAPGAPLAACGGTLLPPARWTLRHTRAEALIQVMRPCPPGPRGCDSRRRQPRHPHLCWRAPLHRLPGRLAARAAAAPGLHAASGGGVAGGRVRGPGCGMQGLH